MSGSESEEGRQVAAGRAEAETTVRRSVFRAVAAPATDRDQALAEVEAARLRHPDARHHCWAWQGRSSAASSDDGEPSGTAGPPILKVIGHKAISDVVVVISRDFGGIKLGAGGLVCRAWRDLPQVIASPVESTDSPAGPAPWVTAYTMETSMSYTINRVIEDADFEAVDERTRKALADHSFGVLTEIDVQATMKKKLGNDMAAYRILGACNPAMAWEAIGVEERVGAMLPCNVILREVADGVEVSAVDPVSSMTGIDNPELMQIAGQVRDRLSVVVQEI